MPVSATVSCMPVSAMEVPVSKDIKALIKTAKSNGYRMRILEAVEAVNEEQKSILFRKLDDYFKGDLKGKRIAMWGLAFKPETDDMREGSFSGLD